MKNKKITRSILLSIALLLALAGAAYAAGNIDAANKWAWAGNAGWLNFNPTHGGVTVYSDHLEGYAWAENIGWVRLGSYAGGGTHSYANSSNTDYGVNNDGSGNLSGYAWSANAGWVNFNPSDGQVTIDPATGEFDGYAWGENVGWIHFKNASPAYNAVTSWWGAAGGGGDIYLPLIFKNPTPGPDLVVDSVTAGGGSITVVIRNAGSAAVTDDFWVDVYFNPSQTPTLNHPWDTIASNGAAWGVTADIPPGNSLTLTVGDAYYRADKSSSSFPAGAQVYAFVDSVNYSTTYGAVYEGNEGNNLSAPVISTAGAGSPVVPAAVSPVPAGLPQR